MIRDHFLPSLLWIPACEIDGDYRTLLSHSVKTGGMAVRNPLESTVFVHDTSKAMTRHLAASPVERNTPFDPGEHRSTVSQASTDARKDRLAREQKILAVRAEGNHNTKDRDARASVAGLWLTVSPSYPNSTCLSRDSLRLRYNHAPLICPRFATDAKPT